jgi:aquaporin rerated protein, other eukaryote
MNQTPTTARSSFSKALKPDTLGNWTTGSRNTIRNHFIAMAGEFLGTFLFLFFAFAPTQIAVTTLKGEDGILPNTSALLFIASAFGVSLTVNVWAFYRINGGMLNPAVRVFLF